MKINTMQPTVQTKQPIIKRVKNAFTKRMDKLKELVSDVFEKEKRPHYIIINGKKIDERDLPNCVSGPSDWVGCTGGRVIFSKEDQDIIDKLSPEDAIKYMGKLISEKKYKFPN